ncbi:MULTISPECIES: restriction endonuclease subunit S [Vibrio]|uniref:restriction endonuclease subunit S n=1 Tax=Vibrio TaxID=662 RepID=UPI00370C58B5
MVPNGWKLTSLGEVCSGKLQTGPFGSQLHAHEYTEEGVPVLMPKDLINFRANHDSAAKIPVNRSEDLKKHILKSGDILFSRRGDVARFALIESDLPTSLCGTGCLKATPNKSHSPLFLSYFLQKNAVKKWLEQNAVGQTMPNMNTAILAELPLMVASCREEEDKIAQILSTWDRGIATTEKLIDASKQQKKALMQQLLTGKQRLIDPETGKAFEGDWEEVKLGELGTVISGGTPSTSSPEYWDGDIHWVTPTDITKLRTQIIQKTSRKITSEGLRNSSAKLVPARSLLICTRATIGELAITATEMCTNQGFKNIIPSACTDVAFLYYLIQSSKHRLVAKASGSTFLELSKKDFENILFHIPSFKEQQKIASVLTAADKEIELLAAKLAHLKQEKKALMQQLLTGKRRVSLSS